MHPTERPAQSEATKAQGDPKSLQPEVNWGGKLFPVEYLALHFKTVS
jgi:hypothetical protein